MDTVQRRRWRLTVDAMSDYSPTRLYIPPNTRLQTVWRVTDPFGNVGWQVYTACHDRNAAWRDMLGTHMQLNPNGSVTRVTLRPDDTVHEMLVMPKLGDE